MCRKVTRRDENFIIDVTQYLKHKYKCHSIILYGSYVTGDFTEESDLDVICFADHVSRQNDNTVLNHVQLDAWIYDTEEMNDPANFLHVSNGSLLLDQRGSGNLLLNKIDEMYKKGPGPSKLNEIAFLKNWLIKMHKRSLKGDTEGDFRYHWLLYDSLEIYFKVMNQWYLGPKKSLEWLKINDPYVYTLFSMALKRNAENSDIVKLIKHITDS